MKRYIKSAISIDNLKEQFGKDIPNNIFRELVELDPTCKYDSGKGGKYAPWILKQYKAGNISEGDYDNLRDALDMFSHDYKKYPNSDIGSYKTVEDFLQATHDVGNRELTDKEKAKLLKKQAHNASTEDKKFLVNDGEWEVWQPLTYAGSISLAREGGHKASWCTAYEGNDHYWQSYTSKGPLFIFLNTSNPDEKYQLHLQTNSWYDIDDRSQGMDAFYDFCAQHPKIGKFFKVYVKDGVTYCANTIVGIDSSAKSVKFDEGITSLPSIRLPKSVKEVILPDSITSIESDFFTRSNVEKVMFNNVSKIGAGAFAKCALISIDLSGVNYIGEKAFYNCKQLQTAVFNTEGVTFGAYAFAEDEALDQSVTLRDEDMLSIGVFDNCKNLTIVWDAEDADYDFTGIKALELDKAACPTLVGCNEGYVPIVEK